MGLLRRYFGPSQPGAPPEATVEDGHMHAPDAHPDEVVLPKQKRSSRSLLAGKPPRGWKRHASDAGGGLWPGDGPGDSSSSFGADSGGGDSGGGD
jgi:hypothetical protein